MQNQATEVLHHLFVLILVLVAAGIIAGRFAAWLRLPDVVVFIAFGILLGPGLHWVNEPSYSLTNQFILAWGATLILFDGGRHIRLEGLRKVAWTVALLSVPGVLITVAVTGTAIHYLFGLEWMYALLAAAVIASTDPASIIPVFRQVHIRDKVRETVESESAFNDATGSIITFAIVGALTGKQMLAAGPIITQFLKTAVGGILVGIGLSIVVAVLVAHKRFGILKDFTIIAMLATAIGAYIIGEMFGVSGFMATFVAGLIWGNSHVLSLRMTQKLDEMRHFMDNLTVIMRMLIFVLLGSQVNFQLLGRYWWQSLLAVFVLMAVARPLTVYASALPDRKADWTHREMLFMVWVEERGVIPAALAGMVAGMGVRHADVIGAITFMAIMLTILVQASTTAWMARKLGVLVNEKPNPA